MKSFVPLVAVLAFAVAGAVPVPQMPPSPFDGMPQMPSPFGGMPQMPSPFDGMGGMPMMPPSPFGGMPQLPPWLMQMFFQMMMNGAQPANMSTLPVNPESEDPATRLQLSVDGSVSWNGFSASGVPNPTSTSTFPNFNFLPMLMQMFANLNPFAAVPSISG